MYEYTFIITLFIMICKYKINQFIPPHIEVGDFLIGVLNEPPPKISADANASLRLKVCAIKVSFSYNSITVILAHYGLKNKKTSRAACLIIRIVFQRLESV